MREQRSGARLRAAIVFFGCWALSSAWGEIASRAGEVATPHGRIHYEVMGSGPPIVLIAGGPGSSHTSLRPDFDRLAATHTVVYFDNMGRGKSSDKLPPGVRHSPERDAEDVENLRVALGFEKMALLGHSYGGYPALLYAARHPERLSHLVISSAGHGAAAWQRNIDNVNRFVQNQFPERWSEVERLRAAQIKSCAPEYQQLYAGPVLTLYWRNREAERLSKPFGNDPRDDHRMSVYCEIIGDDPEWRVGGTMAAMDARPLLAQVRVPALITVGRFDPVSPPVVAYEIRDAFPAGVARVSVFEGSAHRPWAEEPERYFEQLDRFLQTRAP